MANPFFSRSQEFSADAMARHQAAGHGVVSANQTSQLEDAFAGPAATPADTGRMTFEGTTAKTAALLIIVGATAALGWIFPNPLLVIGSAIAGFVLALVISFKRKPSAVLTAIYAAVEGYFLGGITVWIETAYDAPGAGLQALIATGVTFAVVLALYRSGKLQYTPKMRRFFLIGIISYGLFSLVNIGLMLFTDIGGWGLRSEVEIFGIPLGVLVGAFAIILAVISLVADFDFIERGVRGGLPAAFEWKAAFGLVVTLVWLYLEFLRIIAILAGRR